MSKQNDIVLATRFRDGVAFAYDRLITNANNGPESLTDKVLIANDLAVGIAGSFLGFNDIIDDFSQSSSKEAVKKGLERRMQRNLGLSWLSFSSFNSRPFLFPTQSYLIGYMDSGPKLYNADNVALLMEIPFGGIGSGYYPEVRSHLEKHLDTDRTLEDTVEVLNDGMQIAFEINEKDDKKLQGLGFTTITKRGVYTHKPPKRQLVLDYMNHPTQIKYSKGKPIISNVIELNEAYSLK